jgi:hypothetical protein
MGFQFLDLPGEIRNRIYGDALMEPEGLHYHHIGDESTASPDRKQYTKKKRWRGHANQLKLTCRQIRHETQSLGLKFNTLHFKCSNASHSFIRERASLAIPYHTSQFRFDWYRRAFSSNPGPIRVNWIRHITLTHEPSLGIAGWAGICCHLRYHDHTSDCPWIAEYRRTIALVKFAQSHLHVRFDLDIPLPPHGYEDAIPGTKRLVYEIVQHLFLFRGIAWRDLPVDLEILDPPKSTPLLIPNDDSAKLIAPNVRFHVPKEWIDDPSIDKDYNYAWQNRMNFDDYASGQGLIRLKADLTAWAENGF